MHFRHSATLASATYETPFVRREIDCVSDWDFPIASSRLRGCGSIPLMSQAQNRHVPRAPHSLQSNERWFAAIVSLIAFVLACFAAFRGSTPELAAVGFLAFSAIAGLIAAVGTLPVRLAGPGGVGLEFGPEWTPSDLLRFARDLENSDPNDPKQSALARALREAAIYEERILNTLASYVELLDITFDAGISARTQVRTDALVSIDGWRFAVEVKSSRRVTHFSNAGTRLIRAVDSDTDLAGGILVTDYAPADVVFVSETGRPIYTVVSSPESLYPDLLATFAYFERFDRPASEE